PLDYHIPLLNTWSLRLERQLAREWVVSVAYVGNKGTALPVPLQQNPAIYVPGASSVGNTQQRRIYPTNGSIQVADPGGNSEYDAFQVNAEKRFSHGFTVLANYS